MGARVEVVLVWWPLDGRAPPSGLSPASLLWNNTDNVKLISDFSTASVLRK